MDISSSYGLSRLETKNNLTCNYLDDSANTEPRGTHEESESSIKINIPKQPLQI